MESAVGLIAAVAAAGLLVLGSVLMWQGGKVIHDRLALRHRGIWVHGVIERRVAAGSPFGVYRFVDAAGVVRYDNMTSGRLPRAPATETEICYDPKGKVRAQHRRPGTRMEVVAAVAAVLFGVAWSSVLMVWLHTIVTRG